MKMRWISAVAFLVGCTITLCAAWPQRAQGRPFANTTRPTTVGAQGPETAIVREQRMVRAMVGITTLEGMIDAFEVDCGRYPSTDEGLRALLESPPGLMNWQGPYAKVRPLDPWGRPYAYLLPGLHNPGAYDVWSFGLDGLSGTADDIGNWEGARQRPAQPTTAPIRRSLDPQAMTETARSDLKSIAMLALDAFQIDNGRYPTTEEGLRALLTPPANCPNWKGPYVKRWPLDPWGNIYIYRYPGQHHPTSFDLSSLGPDGKPGTADDITNW
jgi:general secretion pathway protein G